MAFKIKNSPFYYCDFWVPERGAEGAIHVNRSLRTRDPDEANRIEEELRIETEETYFKRQGLIVDLNEHHLSDALNWMWESKWQHNVAGQDTRRRIEEIIELVGDVPLTSLSGQQGAQTIMQIRNKVLDSKDGRGRERGRSTVDGYMATLRALLRSMRDDRMITDLKVPKIPMFNEDNRRQRILHPEEQQALFAELDRTDPEFGDLCRFLLDTGMRISEALSIDFRRNMVYLDRREVVIKCSKKRGNVTRTVPLTERARDILLRRRNDNPHGKAFPFTRAAAATRFWRARQNLGPDYANDNGFSLHMLRHTCTSRLIKQGVDIGVVRDWLGHSDAKMTLYYTHAQPADLHKGARILDALNHQIRSLQPCKTISQLSVEEPQSGTILAR